MPVHITNTILKKKKYTKRKQIIKKQAYIQPSNHPHIPTKIFLRDKKSSRNGHAPDPHQFILKPNNNFHLSIDTLY